jgi:hypothetical protein
MQQCHGCSKARGAAGEEGGQLSCVLLCSPLGVVGEEEGVGVVPPTALVLHLAPLVACLFPSRSFACTAQHSSSPGSATHSAAT